MLLSKLDNFLRQFLCEKFYCKKLFFSSLEYDPELLIRTCNVLYKQIAPFSYEVHYSRHLYKRLTQLSQFRNVVEEIKYRLQNSEDVNCFLSKKYFYVDYSDPLLTEWNIFHFHLSTTHNEDPYFVDRTKWLLFAMRKKNAFFFLDILPHSWKSFANKKLLEIVYKNWPETISNQLLGNNTTLSYEPNQKKLYKLRKYNLNISVTVKGNVFIPLGRATDGSSFIAVQNALRFYNLLRNGKVLKDIQVHLHTYSSEINFKIYPFFGTWSIKLVSIINDITEKNLMTYYFSFY